jgi:hypothetical protein
MTEEKFKQLNDELEILRSLDHPNIVRYYGHENLDDCQEFHLYMEYCAGGDLTTVIKNLKAKNMLAEEWTVWHVLAQLVTALYRCHYGVAPREVPESLEPVVSLMVSPQPMSERLCICPQKCVPAKSIQVNPIYGVWGVFSTNYVRSKNPSMRKHTSSSRRRS